MFSRKHANESFSKHKASKSTAGVSKRSFREHTSQRRPNNLDLSFSKQNATQAQTGPTPAYVLPFFSPNILSLIVERTNATRSQLNSATITLSIGKSPPRLFAAHVDVLRTSPYFSHLLTSQYYNSNTRSLTLVSEVPEVFSSILEYLYKGDYFPKLEFDSRRNVWTLENANVSPGNADSSVWMPYSTASTTGAAPMSPSALEPHPTNPAAGQGVYILKDTAVYCAAERYGLPQLKRIALRKQGLQAGIPVATILASAKFAYAHTPESDRHLRAHYLALIIRSRHTFKRSGTMQAEMGMPTANASPRIGAGSGAGTGLWFDLFVAMCNRLDDLEDMHRSPKK